MDGRDPVKLCWIVTGAGHLLRETADLIASCDDVELFLTRAAVEVAARYSLLDGAKFAGVPFKSESEGSAPLIMRLDPSHFDALVLAPATSNTIAKCVHGIADSLASAAYSQSGKAGLPSIILPTDSEQVIESVTTSGRVITIRPRPIDLQNVRQLAAFPATRVVATVGELRAALDNLQG